MRKSDLVYVVILFILCNKGFSQSAISGSIKLDSTWNRIAYLSDIKDLTKLYFMSERMIIDQTNLSNNGVFSFSIDHFPLEDHLYRIHFVKEGDPPASLSIGGRDENYCLVIANRESNLRITFGDDDNPSGNLQYDGYYPNLQMNMAIGLVQELNSPFHLITETKREYLRQYNIDQLKLFADTCSHPIASVLALFHTPFETDNEVDNTFYSRYYRKWKNSDSPYLQSFWLFLPDIEKVQYLKIKIGIALLIVLLAILLLYLRIKKHHKMTSSNLLTVQETRILGFLKEGKTNKQISEECHISLSTVKSHVYSIFSKQEISSRKELIDSNPQN